MSTARPDSFETETEVLSRVLDEPPQEVPTQGGVACHPRLVCVAGADAGKSFLVGTGVVIGRYQADVALTSTDVSRQHASVRVDDHGVVVDDLRSVNGTFLNGVRITGPARARFGDRLQVGSTVFVLTRHDELEQRMQRVQRLEAMGTLGAGIAHDFNNALMVILANLEALEDVLPADATEARGMVDEMRGAATSSAGLARRLMRLGRIESQVFETVPLRALVDNAVAMMQRSTSASIEVSVRVAPELAVHGAHDDLHHMLLNLMINARDAMPDGGSVTVVAKVVRIDAAEAPSRDVAGAGDYIEFGISDSGCGMDEATRARAFEPFFTTKSTERGTGLGLAMIHGIVRRHGGSIELRSWVGTGTSIKILLPRAVVSTDLEL